MEKHFVDGFDVVDGHQAGGSVELSIRPGVVGAYICDQKAGLGIVAPGSGGFDQLGAGVNSHHLRFLLQQQPREHTLTTAEVENAFVGLGVQKPHGGGQDDIPMVIAALVTHQFVIPRRYLVPAAFGWAAVLRRRSGAGVRAVRFAVSGLALRWE